MSDAPEKVWLQLYGDSSPDDGPVDYTRDGVTWCWENIFEHDIEYVRADLRLPPELLNRVREHGSQDPGHFGIWAWTERAAELLRDILELGES